MKKALGSRFDYSVRNCFRAIDIKNSGFISPQELMEFLDKNGFAVTRNELNAVIRRIDSDKDGHVNCCDLNYAIACSSRMSSSISPTKYRSKKVVKTGNKRETQKRPSSAKQVKSGLKQEKK